MVMYAGRAVETAATREIFRSPRMPYTEALLRSLPRLSDATHTRLSAIPGRPPDLARRSGGCSFAPRCLYRTDHCDAEQPALTMAGGLWSTLVNVGLFAWALSSGRPAAEAMPLTFVSLVLIQFVKAYNYRSDRLSVLNRAFANRWLNRAIGWELVLLLVIVYLPSLHGPFGTASLTVGDWVVVVGLALTIAPVLETAKWMARREWFGQLA